MPDFFDELMRRRQSQTMQADPVPRRLARTNMEALFGMQADPAPSPMGGMLPPTAFLPNVAGGAARLPPGVLDSTGRTIANDISWRPSNPAIGGPMLTSAARRPTPKPASKPKPKPSGRSQSGGSLAGALGGIRAGGPTPGSFTPGAVNLPRAPRMPGMPGMGGGRPVTRRKRNPFDRG